MSGYLFGLIGTILLSTILTALLPEGKTTGIIKGITRLACLVVILAPIPKFLQNEDVFGEFLEKNAENLAENPSQNVIATDVEYIEYFRELRIRVNETALERELEDKFSVQAQVQFNWEIEPTEDGDEEIKITRITVSLLEEINEEDENRMWEYLRKNYCSEVQLE